MNINSNKPSFYPCSIEISKCSCYCNNINDPDATLCVPVAVKNIYVKAFNDVSRTDEARYIKWHEACKCKFRLDASVFNNKQRWNKDKYRCEC